MEGMAPEYKTTMIYTGCMLHELSVSSSGLDFSNSNYNYDNANANVSFHLMQQEQRKPCQHGKKITNTKRAHWYPPAGGEGELLKAKGMKRVNNLYQKICSVENLNLADSIARKGKLNKPEIISHDKRREENINALHYMLLNKEYKTSDYKIFTIFERKERVIYKLPYFPDRITHHAVMNVLEPIFVKTFTADTYSCIKGRGIHAATAVLKKVLKDIPGTRYCLKLDIKKFYPSVDHAILKQLLRRKFKDADLLWLLDGIIDSAEGLPIGNYLSQYLSNFYLTYFDHWLKEEKRVRYYFRYADDMVILSDNKPYLHGLLGEIRTYLQVNLKLTVKDTYQVFPVKDRGIDFVGYVFYHTHTLLRKRIKQDFARMLKRNKNPQSIASYKGWAKHSNSKNLLKKLLHERVQSV